MKTYIVLRNGDEIGVFTRRQLKKKIIAGVVVHSDKLCQSGTDSWVKVGEVAKLSDTFSECSNTALEIHPDSVDICPEEVRDKNYDSLLDAEPGSEVICIETQETGFLDAKHPVKEKSIAESELAQATLFATRNYLRRSIFVQQSDKVQNTGYILQGVGLIVLGFCAYSVSASTQTPSGIALSVFGFAIAAIIGVLATMLCCDAGKRLIASTPTVVRENSTLEMSGLMIIVSGIAVIVGLTVISFTAGTYWPAIYGALVLLASVLSAGLVLSPSISNVSFSEVGALEESVNMMTLLAKVATLLAPFIFTCCTAIGVIKGVLLVNTIWPSSDPITAELTMKVWSEPATLILLGGFYSLFAYIFLFGCDMFTRLVK
jgi:hypothetical protein